MLKRDVKLQPTNQPSLSLFEWQGQRPASKNTALVITYISLETVGEPFALSRVSLENNQLKPLVYVDGVMSTEVILAQDGLSSMPRELRGGEKRAICHCQSKKCNLYFAKYSVSQGSVATHLRRGGISTDDLLHFA